MACQCDDNINLSVGMAKPDVKIEKGLNWLMGALERSLNGQCFVFLRAKSICAIQVRCECLASFFDRIQKIMRMTG